MEVFGGVLILAVMLGLIAASVCRWSTPSGCWVVVIAVTGLIGSVVYLALGRPRPA